MKYVSLIYRLRDIHLLIKGLNNQSEKEIALELKWDANRDPSQKVWQTICISIIENVKIFLFP